MSRIVTAGRFIGRALIIGCVIITSPVESVRAAVEVVKIYRSDGDQ